jgi:hypothetical protein
MTGKDGGQTWEYRSGYIDGMLKGKKDAMEELNKNFDF